MKTLQHIQLGCISLGTQSPVCTLAIVQNQTQISDDNIRYYVKYNDRTEYRDFNINIVYKKTDSEQIISFCHDHVEISLPEDN